MKMMKMTLMMMMMMMAMMVGVALGDFVDETCKKTPDYKLCLSLLRSDPHSSTTNSAGLALILVDKIKVLGTQTLQQINKFYQAKPMLKQPLGVCIKNYRTLIDETNDAIIAIRGNPKFAGSVVGGMCYEASRCEKGFSKGQSPLTSSSQRMDKICGILDVIVGMLE